MPVSGFTLLELAIVTVIVGVLASMAAPMVQGVREKALVARAIGDMKAIEIELNQYTVTNMLPPADLAPIERDGMLDPWGNPYAYLAINVGGGGGKGGAPAGARKDKFLVPINSDFDLYSMGPDGLSQPPPRQQGRQGRRHPGQRWELHGSRGVLLSLRWRPFR